MQEIPPRTGQEEFETWMRAALAEGAKGLGLTSPNPPVGAVVVRDGRIIGRGWHPGAGQPHSERFALADAARTAGPDATRGATVVVTLEPCSTHGRTPPCTDALIEAGVARVIWGATDPNPSHAGRGRNILENAGIAVETGVLEAECSRLIRGFAMVRREQRPWITAKWAMSLDGRITRPPGEGRWLSSPQSLDLVQTMRAEADAILCGGATLRHDNPRLTLRHPHPHDECRRKPPLWRVVVTRGGPLPTDAALFTDGLENRTLVARLGMGPPVSGLPPAVRSMAFPDWPSLLRCLASDLDIHHLLVESGGRILGSLIDHQLIDEVAAFVCPLVCGGGVPATGGLGFPATSLSPRLARFEVTRSGPDLCLRGEPDYPSSDPHKRILQPAIFFDRDGVINDPGSNYYVTRWEDFHFHDGAFPLLKRCRDRGYALVLVTSQRGVGKGLMSAADLEDIHQKMQEKLRAEGIAFDRIEAYTGAAADGEGAKPAPSMILDASAAVGIDLSASWVVGDSPRDIVMGQNAGCRTLKIGAPMGPDAPQADLHAPSTAAVPESWPPG